MSFRITRARALVGLCVLLTAVIGSFTVRAAVAQEAATAPNLFDLRGGGITVNYAASSFDGRPRLTYTSGGRSLNFVGDQITAADTAIGTLVTVQIAATPDLSTTSFTVVIPRINVDLGTAAYVRTQAFTTVERTSIAGPAILRGQLQTSRVTTLTGTARAVLF